jgi:L-ascorbate metabolism protein UlaG (beta-lactamase superfamily)
MRQRWLAAIILVLVTTPANAEMTVHFVDVGQGGGVFIEKDGKHIVYDCGDTFAVDTFTSYLDALDVTVIDALVISHAHKDHMGSCAAVIRKFTVKRVYHNGSKAPTATWKAFLKAAKKAEEIVIVDKNLDAGDFDILVAYNSHDRFSKEADNSLVVRLVDGNVRVLLTGDCEAVCEQALMADNGKDMKAAILNVGHHGSNRLIESAVPQARASRNCRNLGGRRESIRASDEVLAAVSRIRREKESQGRLRWLTQEEITALLAACLKSRNAELHPAVVIAINTAYVVANYSA